MHAKVRNWPLKASRSSVTFFFSPIFFSRRKELIGCSCPILYFSIRHPSLIAALNGEINERVLPCGWVILFRWQKNRADHVNTYLRLVLECQDVETKAATGTMNFVDRRLRACGFNFIAVGRVHCAIGSYVRGNSGRWCSSCFLLRTRSLHCGKEW